MASDSDLKQRAGTKRSHRGGRTVTVTYSLTNFESPEQARISAFLDGLGSAVEWDLFGDAPLSFYVYGPPEHDALSLGDDWRTLEDDFRCVFERKRKELVQDLHKGQKTLFDVETLEPHQ